MTYYHVKLIPLSFYFIRLKFTSIPSINKRMLMLPLPLLYPPGKMVINETLLTFKVTDYIKKPI
jgi:hypothetical protein